MIPSLAHLVWFGPKLPWAYAFAVESAARKGNFEKVKLHHSDPLSPEIEEALGAYDNVELVRLDADALMEEAGGARLVETCRALPSLVAKSNLMRAAFCYIEGGVYLDADTITVGSFDAVRASAPGFLGGERIVFPYTVRRSKNPVVHAKAYTKTAIRDVLRRLPRGYRLFPFIEEHYPLAVNGAVMGSVAGHAFVRDYLDAMVEVPLERRTKPHALGTHLLQEVADHYRGDDLRITPPTICYPFAPEISEHLFREYPSVATHEVLGPETAVVHWFASVRTKKVVPEITREYIQARHKTQFFSAIAYDALYR